METVHTFNGYYQCSNGMVTKKENEKHPKDIILG